MSGVCRMIGGAEPVPLPDLAIRLAVQRLCSRRRRFSRAADWIGQIANG
jgi:hypothetical protein